MVKDFFSESREAIIHIFEHEKSADILYFLYKTLEGLNTKNSKSLVSLMIIGLLTKRRHFSHQFMSEVLVDLLIVQKQIHPNIMAIVDGTVCGDGAGPRTMVPRIKNFLLAGYDQVAVDTVVAKMLGFEPLKLPAIKLAHDEGLGCGDFDAIEIIGEEVSGINWNFKVKRSLIIWGDQMVRKGFLQFLNPLLHNKLFFTLPILGSLVFHDMLWYPTIGKKRIKKFSETTWGNLFKTYPKD